MRNFCRLILIPFLALLFGCNEKSERIEDNIKNSRRLRVGMSLNEALRIMGDPDRVRTYKTIHPRYNSIVTTYYYESPFGASDWIHFRVDSAQRLVEITGYDIDRK
jgi:hypothetical protein